VGTAQLAHTAGESILCQEGGDAALPKFIKGMCKAQDRLNELHMCYALYNPFQLFPSIFHPMQLLRMKM